MKYYYIIMKSLERDSSSGFFKESSVTLPDPQKKILKSKTSKGVDLRKTSQTEPPSPYQDYEDSNDTIVPELAPGPTVVPVRPKSAGAYLCFNNDHKGHLYIQWVKDGYSTVRPDCAIAYFKPVREVPKYKLQTNLGR